MKWDHHAMAITSLPPGHDAFVAGARSRGVKGSVKRIALNVKYFAEKVTTMERYQNLRVSCRDSS